MNDDIARSGASAAELELRALCRQLPAESLLPRTRDLQRRHQISALTVQRVLALLARDGVLTVQPGRGSYVAAPRSSIRADLSWQTDTLGSRGELVHDMNQLFLQVPEDTIDLASAYLHPSLQPTGLLASAAARAARRPHAWDKVAVEGLPELRGHIAGLIGANYGIEDVLITSGGQAALSLSFRALAQPGDRILFEHMTYPGALAAARAAGLQPVPVLSDRDGVLPDALAGAFRRTGARLVYLQPRYSNPTGSVLSVDRRPEVLVVLREHNAFCIEDDWVQPLDLNGTSPAPLAALDDTGHVVHVLSLSKPIAPGLRVAAVTSAGAATVRLRRTRITDDLFVAPMMQQTALEVLTAPAWGRHLVGLRRELRNRRDTLLGELATRLPEAPRIDVPAGGMTIWMPLPREINEADFVAAALRAGVALSGGAVYTLGESAAPMLRLTYSRATLPGLRSAAERIAQVCESMA